jgi:hypothetical protein
MNNTKEIEKLNLEIIDLNRIIGMLRNQRGLEQLRLDNLNTELQLEKKKYSDLEDDYDLQCQCRDGYRSEVMALKKQMQKKEDYLNSILT